MRDYHLHELSGDKFEELVIHICRKVLGTGVVNFSAGPDGGRDAKFEGIANNFPSQSLPASGKFIVQAKGTANPVAKCSSTEFKNKVLKKEIPRIKSLKKQREVDNYLLFTNRRLSGLEEPKLVSGLKQKTGVQNIWVIGLETIVSHLDANPDIVATMKLNLFQSPLRIYSKDIAEVIEAFHLQKDSLLNIFDFTYTKMQKKNRLNKLSSEFFQYIQENSEQYFTQIQTFLGRPQNKRHESMYYAIADEIKSKITAERSKYANFDDVIVSLYNTIIEQYPALSLDGKSRFINVFLHYMYCSCDIGQKC